MTIVNFVSHLYEDKEISGNIIEVSSEIYPVFIKGVNGNFRKAEITFDKFHILKIINEAIL